MGDWIAKQRAAILKASISPEDLSSSLFTDRERKRKHYKCGDKFVEVNKIPFLSQSHASTALNEDLAKVKKKKKERKRKRINNELQLGDRVAIWKGDITHIECDVIVNAANEVCKE